MECSVGGERGPACHDRVPGSVVHLGVEDCSEELLRQQSYAIKNQRGARKIHPNGGILRSKAPSMGLWMPELLVLYVIRLLAKQFLGTVLDTEVDQSG